MLSLTCFNKRFTPNWRMSLLTLCSLLFFIRLGIWQLDRADEKKQMLTSQSTLADRKPVEWTAESKLPLQYQKIKVHGDFLSTVLLLDNQPHQHQFGYDVLSPLVLSNGQIVLVDRGWVAGEPTRRFLPKVEVPHGPLTLMGSAYYPSGKNFLLGPVVEKKQGNLVIIELIDVKEISQFLHKSIYPFIIRLNQDEANGYVREWPVVAMSPQRHYGYAVQWFAIALVILILFITLNFKKKT